MEGSDGLGLTRGGGAGSDEHQGWSAGGKACLSHKSSDESGCTDDEGSLAVALGHLLF